MISKTKLLEYYVLWLSFIRLDIFDGSKPWYREFLSNSGVLIGVLLLFDQLVTLMLKSKVGLSN